MTSSQTLTYSNSKREPPIQDSELSEVEEAECDDVADWPGAASDDKSMVLRAARK